MGTTDDLRMQAGNRRTSPEGQRQFLLSADREERFQFLPGLPMIAG